MKLTEYDTVIGYAKRTQICTHACTHIRMLNSIPLIQDNQQIVQLRSNISDMAQRKGNTYSIKASNTYCTKVRYLYLKMAQKPSKT